MCNDVLINRNYSNLVFFLAVVVQTHTFLARHVASIDFRYFFFRTLTECVCVCFFIYLFMMHELTQGGKKNNKKKKIGNSRSMFDAF